VTDTSSCPNSYLEKELVAAGWVQHPHGYSADGADGGVIGYVTLARLRTASTF
jgi:hypothetical protein